MSEKLLENATLILSDRIVNDGSVAIENDRIASIGALGPDEPTQGVVNLSGGTLLPGFIDIHNHGAVGHDVNSSAAEELMEVAAFLAQSGVTAWLPTLVPDSDENYARIIAEIDRLMELQEGKAVAQA